jgi:exosortase/archaeosortase family protein
VLVEYIRNPRFLIGFLLILGGFDIGMWWTKLPRLLGIILMLVGIILVLAELNAQKKKALPSKETITKTDRVKSTTPRLSNMMIQKLTINGRLLPYVWIIGLLIIVADLVLNFFIQKSEIGGNDLITIFFGTILIFYNPPEWMAIGPYKASWIRKKFPREMDFIVIFLGLLILILVIPMYADALWTGHTQGSQPGEMYLDDDIVYVLLTAPLSGILSVLGIANTATGAILSFEMADGGTGLIGIAATCAGIYSFGIFLSAFIAFVLSEYSRFTRRIGVLLVVGSVLTYLANLLRMTLIVLAGYYNGIGNIDNPAPFTLLWTHEYAGEIIFISWVAVFWWIAFKYLASEPEKDLKSVMPTKSDDKIEPPDTEPADDSDWKNKVLKLRKGKTA